MIDGDPIVTTTSAPRLREDPGRAPLRTVAGHVLLVDDDGDLCDSIIEGLGPRGFRFTVRSSAASALAALEAGGASDFDMVVANISASGVNGLELCARMVADFPDLPVVLVTAFGSLDMAIGAVRVGAYDFITKPFELNVLALALDRALCHQRVREQVERLRDAPARKVEIEGIIGTSPPMRRLFELIDRVAATDLPVLLKGQSGTGKGLMARALHQRGRRRNGPFVPVSCAAIPPGRLESELFGHLQGAFADADADRRGLLCKAHGGTLFLDEIADLPSAMQSRLVRALKDRAVRPVGSDQEEPYDARLITATDCDLQVEVEKQRFREDLFYRVHVIQIDVPPLQARGNDILLLAEHFMTRAAGPQRPVRAISAAAAAKLLGYPWPGNVRELENCVARAVAMAETAEIRVEDLPESVANHHGDGQTTPAATPAEPLTLEAVERRHILRVLAAMGGRKAAAAEVLGLHPSTLYRKLEHYGAETPPAGGPAGGEIVR